MQTDLDQHCCSFEERHCLTEQTKLKANEEHISQQALHVLTNCSLLQVDFAGTKSMQSHQLL